MRGEYHQFKGKAKGCTELPPRARRIHHRTQPYYVGLGTTSACAENTTNSRERQKAARNYLRVRGEYMGDAYQLAQALELPPRARRIRLGRHSRGHQLGTTSACAENTRIPTPQRRMDRNYLRVRGEYSAPALEKESTWELPPRARRILSQYVDPKQVYGTTSACAENTFSRVFSCFCGRNYLRVRGEYQGHLDAGIRGLELPPRARRILLTVGVAARL